MSTVVLPALERKQIVISDRMADSSVVYQGYVRGLDLEMIKIINTWAMEEREPDIILYLRISAQTLHMNDSLHATYHLHHLNKNQKNFFRKLVEGFDSTHEIKTKCIYSRWHTKHLNSLSLIATEMILSWIHTNKINHLTRTCNTVPSQLWIGHSNELVAHAHTYMQQRWCLHGGCKHCTTCSLIEQHQYHSALWVEPDGNYTRETLEIIFNTIQFALDENREMIIVIQQADYLTAACYNSLLKSIEEPPRGYHFLLLGRTNRCSCPYHSFTLYHYTFCPYPYRYHTASTCKIFHR